MGSTLIYCEVQDAAGNTETASFTVTVNYTPPADTTPPVVTTTNITYSITNSTGIPHLNYNLPTAGDIITNSTGTYSLPLTPTCIPPPGSSFPVGTTTVNCTATDAAGNVGTGSFTVTIEYVSAECIDWNGVTHCVTLNLPDDMTITTSETYTDVTYTVSGVDNGAPHYLSCNTVPGGLSAMGTSTGPGEYTVEEYDLMVGTHTVYCWMFGTHGPGMEPDPGDGSFTITIVSSTSDTTPPTITVPSNITNSTSFPIITLYVTAFDDSGITSGPNCSPSSGSNFPIGSESAWSGNVNRIILGSNFSVGTTTVTCTATDTAGNMGSESFTVTVVAPQTTPIIVLYTGEDAFPCSDIDLEIAAWDLPPQPNAYTCIGTHYPQHVLQDMTLYISNSSGISHFYYQPPVVIYDGVIYDHSVDCDPGRNTLLSMGTTVYTCHIENDAGIPTTDDTGNPITETFTINLIFAALDTTPPAQNYTIYVNQMRGSGVIDANDPGGCAGLTPQTCYSPSVVTINVGDSVTWINKDTTNNWYTLMGTWGGLAPPGGDNACDGPGKLSTGICVASQEMIGQAGPILLIRLDRLLVIMIGCIKIQRKDLRVLYMYLALWTHHHLLLKRQSLVQPHQVTQLRREHIALDTIPSDDFITVTRRDNQRYIADGQIPSR